MKPVKTLPITPISPTSVAIIKNGVTGQRMQPITRGQSGQGSATPKPGNSGK